MQKKCSFPAIVGNLVNKNRTLKISILIALFALFNLQASTYSQTTKISLDMANVSVEHVLREIEGKSDFKFFFKSSEIDIRRHVSLKVKKMPISEILDMIFNDGSVHYSVVKNQIVLRKELLDINRFLGNVDNPKPLFADQQSVSGTIVDSQGTPIPGASVVEKGTTNGVAADFDGNYTITVSGPTSVLEFRSIGFAAKEVTVDEQSTIDVTLVEDAQSLEEVVIVGYGVQKKSNVTGAIASVESEDLQNRTSENVGQALQGKVSGVQVLTRSGAPNAETSFRIRGYSNTGSSNPLYIVDGLQVSSINYLNPEAIESIEVLKDAASAAIYGAEAGNGVVLITTKSGSGGTTQIFYNMRMAMSSQANKLDMMNADQFKEYWVESGRASEDAFGNANTDWQDVMFGTGQLQFHTLGAQGSNDKGSFYVALNYLRNNGMVVGNKDFNERVTAQVNASYKIKDWLKIGTTNSIERGKTSSILENNGTGTGSAVGGAYFYDPTVPVVYENDSDEPGYLVPAEQNGFNVFRRDGKLYGNSVLFQSNLWNPLGMIDWRDIESWRTNVNGTFYADVTPIRGLVFTSRLGYRINTDYSSDYRHPYYWNPNQVSVDGRLTINANDQFYFQWENFANYLFDIGKSEFAVTAGMQYARTHNKYTYVETRKLTNEAPNYHYLDYSATSADDRIAGNTQIDSRISYFGRLSWTFDNRYTLQGSYRADAYDLSKLSPSNRWGLFPSLSAAWTVTNESFMENINPSGLSSLKLRASWGINGNISSLSNYPYTTTLAIGSDVGSYYYPSSQSGPINGAIPTDQLASPDLTWEESRQVDVGFDSYFFNRRLGFNFDYYDKVTTNLLSSRSAPYVSGATRQIVNAGKIENSGLEFDMSWKDKIGDFNYSLNANLATVHNEVIESPFGTTGRENGGTNWGSPVTYFEAGYPIWYIRTHVTDHIDQDTGLPIYKTAEELGSDDGKTMVGSSIPDFTYGLTLNLEYKGVDLTVFGSGVSGADKFLAIYRPDLPIANLPSFLYNERWTPTNTNARYPRPNSSDDLFPISDTWVFDASYFAINQIQLGYTIPNELLGKFDISSLRLYTSLENFFMFTKYPGNDPESMSTTTPTTGFARTTIGIDRISYPRMKQVVLGLNLKF
jgi:TonB-linked SusC/RagA family outer membrane protein